MRNVIKFMSDLYSYGNVKDVLKFFGFFMVFWSCIFSYSIIVKDRFWFFFAGTKLLYDILYFSIIYFLFDKNEFVIEGVNKC